MYLLILFPFTWIFSITNKTFTWLGYELHGSVLKAPGCSSLSRAALGFSSGCFFWGSVLLIVLVCYFVLVCFLLSLSCAQCCLCFWIVHTCFHIRCSLTFIKYLAMGPNTHNRKWLTCIGTQTTTRNKLMEVLTFIVFIKHHKNIEHTIRKWYKHC